MSALALLTIPCRLLKRTANYANPDEYGNPSWNVVMPDTECEIQQISATEANADALEVTTWRVFLPPIAPVRGWDAIQIIASGWIYELDGDAWEVRNPRTGLSSHVEGFVRRVE